MTASHARPAQLPTHPSWTVIARPGALRDLAEPRPEPVGQRPSVRHRPDRPSPGEVLRLQRVVGNQATGALLRRRRASDAAPEPPQPTVSRFIFRSWSVDDLVRQNRGLYDQLIGKMNAKDMNEKRQLLRSLAVNTASAEEVLTLVTETGDATGLNQALKVAGDVPRLKALGETFKGLPLKNLAMLAGAAGDYQGLIDLATHIKDAQSLYKILQSAGKVSPAKTLIEAITLAGSFDELKTFTPLSFNIVELRDLLKALGPANLKPFLPVAKDAATILALLDITDAVSLLQLMTTHQKAELGALRPLALKAKALKPVTPLGAAVEAVDPINFRFTQATCTGSGEGYTVAGNIQKLKTQPAWHIPGGAIRVFQKTPDMDAWGPLSFDHGTGDPKNLANDQMYTLDNRRLVAYQRAGRPIPKPALAPANVVKNERWKFTTKNQGTSITIV